LEKYVSKYPIDRQELIWKKIKIYLEKYKSKAKNKNTIKLINFIIEKIDEKLLN
jgi:hypothetical protein